ncbi:MAG: MATE family efflux transporter [Clostridiales bacterium]|nr:MATE family efflux transporter [Clostridiales bacterium]
MKHGKTVNLTTGNVWKTMLLYSLPLFGSAMVQQFYSLVDLLVVGNFAAEGALAVDAIGNATVIINILLAFALGANSGCAVIVAKHFGRGDRKRVHETVNTALIAFAVLCAFIMVLGFTLGNVSLKALNVHGSYFNDCLAYLYIYVGSLPFVFLYNLGCGICSALGDSKTPFVFLVISSVLNIGLDLLFVCVLHLDVAGAAWATLISQALSCILTVIVIIRKLRAIRTDEKTKAFDKVLLKDLTLASVPVILQQSFVSLGNFFINKRINLIGEDATTGFTTAFKLISMANMGVIAITNGLSNFTSQNYAAGKYDRVKTGFVSLLCYAMVASVLFLALFVAFPQALTRLFVQSDKLTQAAMDYSVRFITIVSCFLPVVCVKIVADGTVRGTGNNVGFTVSTFADLILRVVLVYILTAVGWGFDGVCWAWAIGWCIGTGIAVLFLFAVFGKLSKWMKAKKEDAPIEEPRTLS